MKNGTQVFMTADLQGKMKKEFTPRFAGLQCAADVCLPSQDLSVGLYLRQNYKKDYA